MSGQHARLSASAAHRWLKCPGSIGGTSKSSQYSADGTFAHSIAAECLEHDYNPQDFLLKRGKVDGFDVECDQEMVDGIQVYLDAVRNDYLYLGGDRIWYEMPLLAPLQQIDPDLGGTADAVRYREMDASLRVFDFKYGAGTYVEVDDNEQMKIYALGAMLQVNQPIKTVTVTIIQPRFTGARPVRDFTFDAYELLDFAADIKEAADKTRVPKPVRVAGDHCQSFCPHASNCPELEKHQHALLAGDFPAVGQSGAVVDYKALAAALASVPLVKARLKAIEELAYTEAVAGRFTDTYGYKLVDKRPQRKWKSEGDVIEWAQKNAVEPWAPRELLSVAQLEKKLGESAPKGKKKEAGKVLEPFVEKVSSGTALVPVSDERPAAQRVSVEEFAAIDGTADKT